MGGTDWTSQGRLVRAGAHLLPARFRSMPLRLFERPPACRLVNLPSGCWLRRCWPSTAAQAVVQARRFQGRAGAPLLAARAHLQDRCAAPTQARTFCVDMARDKLLAPSVCRCWRSAQMPARLTAPRTRTLRVARRAVGVHRRAPLSS